jgi:hypothetical protein
MRFVTLRRAALTIVAAAALLVVVAQSAFADPRDFQLQNNSAVDIAYVYVSPSDINAWGDDVMGASVLPAGQAVSLTFGEFDGSSCAYDIKVVGSQGEVGYLYKVDLCSVDTVTFS